MDDPAQPRSAIGPFPRDVALACGRTGAQRLLGHAVPSLLAEVLRRAIREQLLDAPLRTPLRLMPPRRATTPAPESVASVPSRYLSLVGNHEEHPGTGLGWGSLGRLPERALAAGE